MKKIKIISCILCLVICICCGCSSKANQKSTSSQSNTISNNEKNKTITVHKDKNTIKERYDVPEGYERVRTEENSFGEFLRNSKLRLQGNDNFIHEAIRIGGGENPFAQEANTGNNKDISMEEVYRINPDIILLSNFDNFVPDDLYENRIAGQDWSTVKAVQNHRVYKVPMGIYRWDAPGVETPLMMKWLAKLLQPEIFKDMDVRADTKKFYKDFMKYDVSDEDLAMIFADKENRNSDWELGISS